MTASTTSTATGLSTGVFGFFSKRTLLGGLFCFSWLICLTGGLNPAMAQEFTMLTKVYEDSHPDQPVVSRSLTLFHAGEVYDWLDDAGEVIIMQPISKKFVILNTRSDTMTEITFAQIEQMLDLADDETKKHLNNLATQPHDKELYRRIEFFQEPQFQRSVDVHEKQLKLSSPYISYAVHFHNDRPEAYARKYLDFADWVKKLNYVRHPMDTSYRARLELNNRLRSIKALPQTVRMTASTAFGDVKLRSEHRIEWKLNDMDRERINHWNSQIKSESTRRITIEQYQKNLHALR